MPGKFNGWLIKFGDVTLPNSFLLADGWESTPNQRVEIDAYRDANILLHRETSPNFKTKLKLNIREMNLEERMAFDNAIGLATLPTTEKNQRRVRCTYWNDETLEYATGAFYMSDTTYTIHTLSEDEKDIEYNEFTLTLTEY
nr:MAG TPA: hypothetical protein [Caudoviricetes sp.]DAO54796.1 MAG TPA: hypothetical protein [Caudoviricetes sp.]